MALASLITRFFSSVDKTECFEIHVDDGVDFVASKAKLAAIKSGDAPEWITAQYVALKMLEEEGKIFAFPDGFMMPSKVAVNVDSEVKALLALPPSWKGLITADIKGTANQSHFSVDLAVQNTRGQLTYNYKIDGPFITFSAEKRFLLTPLQYAVFDAQKQHSLSSQSEYDNLLFLHQLQKAKTKGCAITLAHFERLQIITPEFITIDAELDSAGNLVLTPNMGQTANAAALQRVLGQLNNDNACTLKVGDEIILFSKARLKAVKEVLSNRIIAKDNICQFLQNPTAYIDASLVDLELGFSYRVHGATLFKHAYFGEIEGSGIDWFNHKITANCIFPISRILTEITDESTFALFVNQCLDAQKTSASVMDFDGKSYDISDKDLVDETINKLEQKIKLQQENFDDDNDDAQFDTITPNTAKNDVEIHVVDIDLNDKELGQCSPLIDKLIDDIAWQGELHWHNYLRQPFSHQEEGIRWALGLINKNIDEGTVSGALLADDMGLGKTFIALSTIDHFYQQCEAQGVTQKPILIVAPLGLLENWQAEVNKTFASSPFDSIVILQTHAELGKFKVAKSQGVEIHGQSHQDFKELELKYALKVGKSFGSHRLDLPKRLVITTYQTLRDYQFSLCVIDWSVIVFDEAQNIKNPNALQTRAAKGLKAQFKLLMTGTPVENSLADFWCLLDTANSGYLSTYQDFRSQYITPILRAAKDEQEEMRLLIGQKLRMHVGALMLRRIKEDSIEGLPNKYLYSGGEFEGWRYLPELSSTMTGFQKAVYESVLHSQSEAKQHFLSMLLRLRDSALHPRLLDAGSLKTPERRHELEALFFESGKLQSLIKILNVIKEKKQKCIIFAMNKRLQSFLSTSLGKWYALGPVSIINGDTKALSERKPSLTRTAIIKAFENKPEFNIIIMSPVAAGVGLTVVEANHVIHLERHWNPAKEAQATDRVYRIGQKEDVHIYVPILHHPEFESFDANLHKLLTGKTRLKDALMAQEEVIPNPEGIAQISASTRINEENIDKLSWEQFEALALELLAKEYTAQSAWLTKEGKDFGADGVILGTDNLLIQAKYTQGKKYDGYKAVQEIHAAKPIYEKAMQQSFTKLIFITNAISINSQTLSIAKASNVKVIDRSQLITLLNQHVILYVDLINRMGKTRIRL